MEKLSANISSLRGPSVATERQPSAKPGLPGEFAGQLQALQQPVPTPVNAPAPAGLRFSNHAVDRMQARGIRFTPDEMTRIQTAVAKAAGKGSRETLLITDQAAMIVSVKDKTVVTVMDKASLKENVFTNIDSTVMI